MSSFDDILAQYDYSVPPELIAQEPASPRDSAKLVVLDQIKNETTWTTFREVGNFLPKNAVLVLNETKVIPARLTLTRDTGGTVSVLRLHADEKTMRVLSPKKLRVGETLSLNGQPMFTVEAQDGKEWQLQALMDENAREKIFEEQGSMPLPPYIKHTPLSEKELRTAYQTVFAKEKGSIAAPTASLHFTEELLEQLQKDGIQIVRVTLHVHLGTFAPLEEDQWQTGKLHREEYHIPQETIDVLEQAKQNHRLIIAVGTTVVRTLESAFDVEGHCTQPEGDTQLFIREGYAFKMIDGMITNFHVPKSSLLMLVSTFAGRETVMDLYKRAIGKKFRFFSFGDAMLMLREPAQTLS